MLCDPAASINPCRRTNLLVLTPSFRGYWEEHVWQWVRSFFGTPLQPQDPYRRDLGEEITQFPVVQRALQVQLLRRNLRNPHVTGSVGTMMGL